MTDLELLYRDACVPGALTARMRLEDMRSRGARAASDVVPTPAEEWGTTPAGPPSSFGRIEADTIRIRGRI